MDLHLKYAPEPENMPRFAADIVDAAEEISGVRLDYSVASLASVDEILGDMHDDGVPSEQVAATLVGFGAYVGEVFVRHAAGAWAIDSRLGELPVVRLPSGDLCNPIGKCFKRVDHGDVDNLAYFYRVFTTAP